MTAPFSPIPVISVVIPVYNAARYLRSAIASVQAQTFRDFEIIAVDDGSTDASKKILDALAAADPRIRVISRPNTGIVGALNDGLAAARGEFIARMDGDDLCLPERFERQLAYLRNHPECVALGSDILFTDPDGEPLVRLEPRLDHDGIVAQLIEGNGGAIIHPALMARRAAIEQIGRYRIETRNFLEDLDLYLRLAEIGQLANLPEILLHYRQHLKSINRLPGPRAEIGRIVLNPHRRARGLPDYVPPAPIDFAPTDWWRHWSYEAARGESWPVARKNAWRAWRTGPFDPRNWQCLKYVWLSAKPAVKRPLHS